MTTTFNQSPLDAAREYFQACPNCEPVGCCNGQECGCQGQPVDFNVTDKCGDDCYAKLWQEVKALRRDTVPRAEAEKRLVWWAQNHVGYNCGRNEQGFWIQHIGPGEAVAQRHSSFFDAVGEAIKNTTIHHD